MRRRGDELTLTTEHRAAPSQEHLPLALQQSGDALALALSARAPAVTPKSTASPSQRVRQALSGLSEPVPVQRLRQLCGMRTADVCAALAELSEQGLVSRDNRGYQLKLPFDDPLISLPIPIDPGGNGNGKRRLSPAGHGGP
jgi:predicted Rossmann fold nucleotide-binding protein DprA/Smf involved in DNA uptake